MIEMVFRCVSPTLRVLRSAARVAAFPLLAATVAAAPVTVRVESLQPDGGLFFTPLWVAFQDGGFDIYDSGSPASAALEAIAEDGDIAPLSTAFMGSSSGSGGGGSGIDGVIAGMSVAPPPFNPGESAVMNFDVPDPATNRYFSYAAMLVPSNDAFFANGNPLAHAVFDMAGNFAGPIVIDIFGSNILDAGTESNTEMEAAFINQTGPNMGTPEGGVVHAHPGFIGSATGPAGTPIILGGTTAAGTTVDPALGDFTLNQGAVPIARITVTPEPSSVVLAAIALALSGATWTARRFAAKKKRRGNR
jgi:hypothetical protein